MAESKAAQDVGVVEKVSAFVINLHPRCVVAEKAMLTGDHPINVAANAIIHPFACIDSTAGPVSIGEGVIIWEKATIGASDAAGEPRPIQVGDLSVVEALAVVSPGCSIGHHSEIGVRAHIGPDCKLGNYVKITPACVISGETQLSDFTVVFGDPQQMRIDRTAQSQHVVRDLKERNHMRHIETLKKLVKSGNAKWT